MNWYSSIKQHELNVSEAQNHQINTGHWKSIGRIIVKESCFNSISGGCLYFCLAISLHN